MANLKNIIYISNADFETLVSTGTVTINGETLTYDPDNVYITPDELATTTNDGLMSSSDKTKLDSIQSGAEANVQSDWNVSDSSSDAFIKNKPTIPSMTNVAYKNVDNNFSTMQTVIGGIRLDNRTGSGATPHEEITSEEVAGAGSFLFLRGNWGVKVPNNLYVDGLANLSYLVPTQIGWETGDTIYEWQQVYKTRKEVDSSTVSASYGVQFPDTTGYSANQTLATTSQIPGSSKGITYLTTAPSAANTDGGLIIVVLSSEPTTKYDGYIYLITE